MALYIANPFSSSVAGTLDFCSADASSEAIVILLQSHKAFFLIYNLLGTTCIKGPKVLPLW